MFLKSLILCLLSVRLFAASAEAVFAEKKEGLTIGIISAVPGESNRLLELMEFPQPHEIGKRTYYRGKLNRIDTVLVSSRVGKVAAAATTAHLILAYQVDIVIFTGVAGSIDPIAKVGDVVIGQALLQHDMDARPFCSLYEIPLLKIKELPSDPLLVRLAERASQQLVEKELSSAIPSFILKEFNIHQPKVLRGLILTGDRVIAQEDQKMELKAHLPNALCVEMEGASVSQVCYENGIPCVVIRTISDYANHENTPTTVTKFVNEASGYYSLAIIKNMYQFIHATIGEKTR